MIELDAPCRKHVLYYPQKLAALALQQKQYSVFISSCECGTAYIVALQDNGAHNRVGGDPHAIIERYESIPWKEKSVSDTNGVFFYKLAPSLDALKQFFDTLKKQTKNREDQQDSHCRMFCNGCLCV